MCNISSCQHNLNRHHFIIIITIDNIKIEFKFPEEFPNATTGVFIPENNTLITGHENGYVVKWDTKTQEHEIIHDCKSLVRAVSISNNNNDILVGCISGLLFIFSLSAPNVKTILQESKYNKWSRVWRSIWLDENNIVSTSTYGQLYHYDRKDLGWECVPLLGHSDSIFGIGSQNNKYLATGDYRGKIVVWNLKEETDGMVDTLQVQGTVQGISWINDDSFVAIDDLGHINQFELNTEKDQWKKVFQVDVATSAGITINVTSDGKTVFAGTRTEIIQIDLDTQQIQTTPLQNSREIFSRGDTVYVLTKQELHSFQRTEIKTPYTSIKYKYAKISLVGHTGVGKSTLCNMITTDSTENTKSTFGKKVYEWPISNENAPAKQRRFLHDHGGQKAVLSTYLPFLSDSDIVLLLFKKTDSETFERVKTILNYLESRTNQTKFFLVKTHIDQKVDNTNEDAIESLKNSNKVIDCLDVSLLTQTGLKKLKERIAQEISWSNARTVVESKHVERLEDTISYFKMNNADIVNFKEFKEYYNNEFASHDISNEHLRFLLKSFSSQGLIEYYSELESIIFNDTEYNEFRSGIPMLVENKNGIVSMGDIRNKFGNSKYVAVIDKVFLEHSLAIQCGNLQIFPDHLKSELIEITEPSRSLLKNPVICKKIRFKTDPIEISNIIRAFSELRLECVTLSKKDGLFCWGTNACIYYAISDTSDAINGKLVEISYTIGGRKKKTCDRLDREFKDILKLVFDPNSKLKKI